MTFEFYIGGYPGPSFNLEVINDQLEINHHHDTYGAPHNYSIPLAGNAAWNDVMQYLSTRKWKEEYVNVNVLDGTSWNLLANAPGISIQSHGSNMYPPGFTKFLRLLNIVTAKEGIKVY